MIIVNYNIVIWAAQEYIEAKISNRKILTYLVYLEPNLFGTY